MTAVLEQFGQGGNCELAGNSHFDGSYLIADGTEAWVLETAGRQWVARKLTDSIGSISNVLGIHCRLGSLFAPRQRVDWAATFGEMEIVPKIGSRRAAVALALGVWKRNGARSAVKTAFDMLRQHGRISTTRRPPRRIPISACMPDRAITACGRRPARWWRRTGRTA